VEDIIFEILKIVVMVVALVVARYVIPWLKGVIDANNLDIVIEWVTNAVLKAQQVFQTSSGEEKKKIVVEFLKELLTAKNISITDEQLDTLIEAAVKEMKMNENVVITGIEEATEGDSDE